MKTLAWEQKKADSDLFDTSGEAASVKSPIESRNPETLKTPFQTIQTLKITTVTVVGNNTELSTIIYL